VIENRTSLTKKYPITLSENFNRVIFAQVIVNHFAFSFSIGITLYMISNYRNYWLIGSITFVVAIVFISEWINTMKFILIPIGFRHTAILIVFFTNWMIFGRGVKLSKYYSLVLFLMIFYLFISYSFLIVKTYNYILGFGFTFLFLLMFIICSNTRSSENTVMNIFYAILILLVLMSIVPIFQALYLNITLRDKFGLFREAGAFGTAMNIGVIISIALFISTSKRRFIIVAMFFSVGVLLTILKKSIIGNLLIWIGYFIFITSKNKRIVIFTAGLVILIIAYFFIGNKFIIDVNLNMEYLNQVGFNKHVRLGMYIAGFNIASDYFPLGSGLGTFGSLASIINGYSDIYIKYGISQIGYNSQYDVATGHFTILDTYWPHIIGELGFIGSCLFLYLWLFPLFIPIKILRKCKDPRIRAFCFYIIFVILLMTNDGFSLYIPEIPSFVVLHSGISGLCYYHIIRYYKKNSQTKVQFDKDIIPMLNENAK